MAVDRHNRRHLNVQALDLNPQNPLRFSVHAVLRCFSTAGGREAGRRPDEGGLACPRHQAHLPAMPIPGGRGSVRAVPLRTSIPTPPHGCLSRRPCVFFEYQSFPPRTSGTAPSSSPTRTNDNAVRLFPIPARRIGNLGMQCVLSTSEGVHRWEPGYRCWFCQATGFHSQLLQSWAAGWGR